MMKLLTIENWPDYELIDSGEGEKLERFGDQIIARPEPQAFWRKNLSNHEWQELANAYFLKGKANKNNDEWGEWKLKPKAKEQWTITYKYNEMSLKMRLGLTSFKHVGVFPEQASNWNFIYDTIKSFNSPNIKVLNLFAYTGIASLAAKSAGAEVTHVDSVKQVVTWSRENMEQSSLNDIRWIVDDAVKFVNREVRRGNKYNGIILDPPAYGRGPDGEKWILEENLTPLLEQCKHLLSEENNFFILNLYSMGFSSLIAESLVRSIFNPTDYEFGELYVTDKGIRKLPLGIFMRFKTF
ncbi:MAG: class I SAM-dependent methyltransferase [Bacteroidales bacterium]